MSSNVGLSTPRGSGTSGYIQRNKSFLRSRDQSLLTSGTATNGADLQKYRQRAPDKEILLHDRKRAVEVKCLQLQDKLEEEDKYVFLHVYIYMSSLSRLTRLWGA
jgi:hypothetical protein